MFARKAPMWDKVAMTALKFTSLPDLHFLVPPYVPPWICSWCTKSLTSAYTVFTTLRWPRDHSPMNYWQLCASWSPQTPHLWFSAGHLAIQSLRWLSYSTDNTLRFGQSAANHDCQCRKKKSHEQRWEGWPSVQMFEFVMRVPTFNITSVALILPSASTLCSLRRFLPPSFRPRSHDLAASTSWRRPRESREWRAHLLWSAGCKLTWQK